ncbi:MAG TPA: 3-dehydroquinate synthase [Bacteroidales bacterium]|nr:3-dehydroquinate synthase [Bacteroidales bacterium]
MPTIKLNTGAGTTEISIPGRLEDIRRLCNPARTILLVDENVNRLHGQTFDGFMVIDIGSGEGSKTIDHASWIYGELISREVDRSWSVVGIGGGIATDLAGFIASTFLRGLNFGFVSTTLLGQVDAAIGGKNGLNYKGYKNMIGVIRQPGFVICDTELLKSLPKREFIGGFAEIIKYAAIRRPDLYPYLQNHILEATSFNNEVLTHLIRESVATKIEIVESDEHERGDRKLLNFGHTCGHALEKRYQVSHGEAVAIGMILAGRLSVNLGMISSGKVSGLEKLIAEAGLPVEMDFDITEIAEIMRSDKKRRGDDLQFILLEDLGKAVVKSIPLNDLNAMLHDLY